MNESPAIVRLRRKSLLPLLENRVWMSMNMLHLTARMLGRSLKAGEFQLPALAEGNEIDSYNEMDIENGDDQGGFVEVYENFVATNIDGSEVFIVRSPQYVDYLNRGEGSYLLDPHGDPDDDNESFS